MLFKKQPFEKNIAQSSNLKERLRNITNSLSVHFDILGVDKKVNRSIAHYFESMSLIFPGKELHLRIACHDKIIRIHLYHEDEIIAILPEEGLLRILGLSSSTPLNLLKYIESYFEKIAGQCELDPHELVLRIMMCDQQVIVKLFQGAIPYREVKTSEIIDLLGI